MFSLTSGNGKWQREIPTVEGTYWMADATGKNIEARAIFVLPNTGPQHGAPWARWYWSEPLLPPPPAPNITRMVTFSDG